MPGAGGTRQAVLRKAPAASPGGDTTRIQARLWQQASKAYLQSHPLCVECVKLGRYTKATVVDHIVPHRGDQKLFWDQSNWQALCKSHHDRKTLTEDINPTYRY